MKIISINFNSSISEVDVDNIENFIKENKLIKIYYWTFNNKRINCYVNIEENIIRNQHLLPTNGISDIFDIESDQLEIENIIYMISSQKSIYCDLTLEDYGLFYFELNETSSSDDDVSINNESENEIYSIIISNEKLKIDTKNTLDYDINEY
jgi:hypothetical protein